jgi:hypothetical protein
MPRFLNSMLLVLDQLFVHRARGKEGKHGNPLNEVRVLCRSILENDGVMVADTSIKLDPAASVLEHQVGDRIALTPSDFRPPQRGVLRRDRAQVRRAVLSAGVRQPQGPTRRNPRRANRRSDARLPSVMTAPTSSTPSRCSRRSEVRTASTPSPCRLWAADVATGSM